MDLAQIPKLHSYDQQNTLYKEAYLVFDGGGEKPAVAPAAAEAPKAEPEAAKDDTERPKDELEMEQIMKSIFEGMGLESLFGVFSGFVDDITKYLRDCQDPFSKAIYELLISEENRTKPTATPAPTDGETASDGKKKEEEKADEGVKYQEVTNDLSQLVISFVKADFTRLNEKKAGNLGFLDDSNLEAKITNIYTELQRQNQTPNFTDLIKKADGVLLDLKAKLPDTYKNFADSKLIQEGKVYLPEGVSELAETDNNKKLLELYTVILGMKTGMKSKIKAPEAEPKPEAPEAPETTNKIDPNSLKELKGKTIEVTAGQTDSVNFNFIDANKNSIPCSLLLAADIAERESNGKKTDAASLLTIGDAVYKIEAEQDVIFLGKVYPFVAFSAVKFDQNGTEVTLTAGAPKVQKVNGFQPGAPLALGKLEGFIADLANSKPKHKKFPVENSNGKRQTLIFTQIS